MSCMVMSPEPLAALANAVEARLNCLYRELNDCKTSRTYFAEAIYKKLYALNIRAYNGRYSGHEKPVGEEAPIIDGSMYIIHRRPAYREHGFAVRAWHYHLAKLLDFWLYQTLEDATHNDPLRLAMVEFQRALYTFIVTNSTEYADVQWEGLPQPTAEENREEVEPDAGLQQVHDRKALGDAGHRLFRLLQKGYAALRRWK